ncbi:MAG TPA: hypothetical protein VHD88_01040 [Pyrinomonadaceae bacterium]|nr:hypothetical protein [Pyrinomonadaceae bacterium]
MDYKKITATLVFAICVAGLTATASAQDKPAVEKPVAEKPATVEKGSARDPFKKYAVERKVTKATASKLEPPSIEVRIERYRAQKLAAAAAHVAPPKPTTALLLNEMQVVGIFRTPRGWAAMVEATPIKLSYVIYPGETFFDGQLVAIEESRLVFRRDTIWNDGRHEKSAEIKPLRQPRPVEAMTAAKAAPAKAPAPETVKPTAPEKQ